jgi:hypothetical protein
MSKHTKGDLQQIQSLPLSFEEYKKSMKVV